MKQLNLPIIPRLEYSAENFITHSGVREGYQFCLNSLHSERSLHAFFFGERRSGKSHMALSLANGAQQTCLLEGAEFSALMHHYPAAHIAKRGRVLIVDDVQLYLDALRPGQSGPLVALFEECRLAQTSLIFFSNKSLNEFAFDEHVATRLAASLLFSLLPPQAEELELLVQAMAKQRGLFLSRRHVLSLARKLPRDLAVLEEFLQQFNALDDNRQRLNLASVLCDGF